MAIRPVSSLPPPHRPVEPVRSAGLSPKPVDQIVPDNVSLRTLSRLIDQHMVPPPVQKQDNWEKKTEEELGTFVQKTSMFVIAHLMLPNIKYEDAIKIVIDTYNSHGNCSFYETFRSHFKDLSFFGQCRAAALYFIFYSSGIIPNTLEAIMRSVLKHLSHLAQEEGGKKLEAMVDNRVNAFDSFLNVYLDAKKCYATVVEGKGQDRRPAAVIARTYEKNEKETCLEFAQTIIREFLPHVPFFRRWREHRFVPVKVIGAILAPLPERLLNWILRFSAKKLIPPQVYTLVKTGTAAAQKGNLPFAIAITRAFLEQLQKIEAQLKDSTGPLEIAKRPVADNKHLRPVVKILLQVLDLQSSDTPDEIQDKLKSSRGWLGQLKKVSEEKLQESAVDACHTVLKFVSNPDNSNELFFRLLQLSNSPFESVPSATAEQLRNEFEELSLERLRIAGKVFQEIVKQSVNEKFHGLPEETVRKIAMEITSKERREMGTLTNQLRAAVALVREKLKSSQTVIPELIQMMEQIKAWQKKMSLEDLSMLPDERQQSIEKSMAPLCRNLYSIFQDTATAKEHQEKFLQQTELEKEIRSVLVHLQKPSHWKTFADALKQASLYPEFKAIVDPLIALKQSIDALQSEFEDGERHLQTLARLDPLLKQFYSLVVKWQNTRSTRSLKETRLKIETELRLLPAEWQKKVQACLRPIDTAKRKDNLEAARQKLQQELSSLAQTGKEDQTANRKETQAALEQANALTGQLHKAVSTSLSQLHNQLSARSTSIGEKIGQLVADQEKINADPPPKKWFDQTKRRFIKPYVPRILGVALGAILGVGISYSNHSIAAAATAGTLSSLFAGLVELYEHGIEEPQNKSGRSDWSKVASKIVTKLVRGAVFGLTCHSAAMTMPALGPVIGPYLGPTIWPAYEGYNAGRDVGKAWTNAVETEVYKLVITAFDNLYDFVLQEHVWRWCIMDTMHAINTAYKPTK